MTQNKLKLLVLTLGTLTILTACILSISYINSSYKQNLLNTKECLDNGKAVEITSHPSSIATVNCQKN